MLWAPISQPSAARSAISRGVSIGSRTPAEASHSLRPPRSPAVTYRVAARPRSVSSGHALAAKSAKPSSKVSTTGRGGS